MNSTQEKVMTVNKALNNRQLKLAGQPLRGCPLAGRYNFYEPMRKIILFGLLFLLSCQAEQNQLNKYIFLEKSELPYKVSGVLEISIEEGTVGEDEISAINFGFIDTGNGKIGIDLTDDVIRGVGLSRDDLHKNLKVQAILVESDYSDDSNDSQSYLIENLRVISEKL